MKIILKYLCFTYKIVDVKRYNLSRSTYYKISYRPRFWIYPIGFICFAIAKFLRLIVDYMKEMRELLFNSFGENDTIKIQSIGKPTVKEIYDSILP